MRLRVLCCTAVITPDPRMACRDVHAEGGATEREEALYKELVGLTGRLHDIHGTRLKFVLGDDRIPAKSAPVSGI
jgi:hypothetical protein